MPPTEARHRVGIATLLGSPAHRPVRVVTLVACIIVLSLADLYMTLVHLLHFGLLEANPVARTIMALGSPAALILWKCVTVGTATGIFLWGRRKWTAEWAAAFCCCIMLWLTGRWVLYNLQVSDMTPAMQAVAENGDPPFVTMTHVQP